MNIRFLRWSNLPRGLAVLTALHLLLSPAYGESPRSSFTTILSKDLTRLAAATSFSRTDRIYLHTVWTGLTGSHEVKVLWIRPDKKIQETTRFAFSVPPGNTSYRTWAWLSFKKGMLNVSGGEVKFIGAWKAHLFLDGKFLAEYSFFIS